MSFLRLKRSKILALVIVFSMLFSCGIALGDNAGENGNGNATGEVHSGDNGSIETPSDNSAPADENGTLGSGHELGTPGDSGEADGDGVNQGEEVTEEGEGQLDSDEGGSDQSEGTLDSGEGTPADGDGNNPSGVELTINEPQLLMAPMVVESEADDNNDYLDLTLTRIRPVDGDWQDINNGMSLISGQEYEVEYKATNTYDPWPLTYVKITKIKLTVNHSGNNIVSQNIKDLRSPEEKNTPRERIGTYTFVAQEGNHTLVNEVDGQRKVAFWLEQSAQVSFSYIAVNTTPECQKVYLKDVHKLADSFTGKFKDGEPIDTGDNGGLNGYAVVWHFVLNQITKDLNEPLTINASFTNTGEKSAVASQVNKQMQHFYVGTGSHDVLKDAYICLPAGVSANDEINLSHIWVNPSQNSTGGIEIVKTIGSTDGDPQEGIAFSLTRMSDENVSRMADIESEGGTGNTATTNENGIALFPDLEPGRYMLEEDVPEGFTTSLNEGNNIIEVAAGQTATVTVVNTPNIPPGSVRVIKTISTTNEPQAGVEFALTRSTEAPQVRIAPWSQTVSTDAHGIALFENLAPGNYNLAENVPPGYMTNLSQDYVVTVIEGETSEVYVENTPLGSVKVTKTISTGDPQKGVNFYLRRVIEEARALIVSLTDIGPVLTDDDGIAWFENLEPGEYNLYEEVPDGYETSLNDENRLVTVTAGETAEANVVNTPVDSEGPGGGDTEEPGDPDDGDTEEPGDPGDSGSSGGGSTGGGSSGGSGGSSDNTVTIEPEPTEVLPEPEQELQILPEPVAVEPEQEIEVQPEATAAGPELPRTGGGGLALIIGSLVAGSGLLLMTRSRKEDK